VAVGGFDGVGMTARPRVELFEGIRRDHRREGFSTRVGGAPWGASAHGAPGVVVTAAAATEVAQRDAPVLGPWHEAIDAWLVADLAMPKKQRHTARRVWERLVDEREVEVAEATVRAYVIGARRRLGVIQPGGGDGPADAPMYSQRRSHCSSTDHRDHHRDPRSDPHPDGPRRTTDHPARRPSHHYRPLTVGTWRTEPPLPRPTQRRSVGFVEPAPNVVNATSPGGHGLPAHGSPH
jgi:hypothetical protein